MLFFWLGSFSYVCCVVPRAFFKHPRSGPRSTAACSCIPVGQAIAPINCTYPGTASVQAISSSGVHNKHYMQTISFPASLISGIPATSLGWSTGKKGEKAYMLGTSCAGPPAATCSLVAIEQKLGPTKSQLSRDLHPPLTSVFCNLSRPGDAQEDAARYIQRCAQTSAK